FEAALNAAGAPATDTVHVGDSPENDVAGAKAAGMRAILLRRPTGNAGAESTKQRSAETGKGDDIPVIPTLAELPRLLI
ncbi:MAG: HAD-hyrolase-like, partial [Acidimicrobiaceae bacterium]|nr:HAD-hyrolase-like [Acidimicrobiaceae bacterium]